ncbi:hypothetical protein [Brevundimonas diminuta]|uniref:Uncharacterized protein n=1 Tax=Brevundimonas diminuta TaxID=293 RepID=A0A410NSS1_BREDI|nr:hypothetical protein [Brevundimonas diminuta]QAT13024.1 hypothetical protein EQG53_00885 [Brevundimonas diminuta]QQB89629.1 hypothetical protein I6H83_04080 [Brevundimonas diminuta]GEC01808.1 hypothetical protein BDI01nite_28720 [Brevundimonas diminuta]
MTHTPADPERPAITGRLLALAVATDFEAFFEPGEAPHVNIVVGAVGAPAIRSIKDAVVILQPKDMADQVVDTPATMFFHLFALGHEIAHLVHQHLRGASGQPVEDYRGLEMWADFYGAKVAMALVTYGSTIHHLTAAFYPGETNQFSCLKDVGVALGRLAQTWYGDPSPRYASRLVRVGLGYNGIMSFLRHHLGPQFKNDLYEQVFRAIYRTEALSKFVVLEGDSVTVDEEPIHRSALWHREMQGDAAALTPGFRPELLNILHTTFDQTEEEIEESRATRLKELRDAGFDI